ncbi:hypothetical protein DYD21_16580 [Rhodohalobacter sp. SW132]|uniref:hypothetical protein n=1 Tax=Rhodohalobacter sp. SW132 TaxID=2293433 RepID=UPI000E24C975|nr:hypothetical protein [Rhodohalobacter sp. SW132]REL24777.1 hypothetical protein DYD21_16580 [Rhodohalobacter sp. SW132]
MAYIRYGLSLVVFTTFLLFTAADSKAQFIFERTAVEVSNLGISYTNVGTIGRPNVRNQPIGLPSMAYPRDSGTEHLFEAGIWLGAIVDGQTRVSTSAVTNPAGYSTGAAGFEFTNDGTVFNQLSTLTDSPDFSPIAVSHQDLITQFTDRNTTVSGQPISGHENPLFADINFESYNWNFGFTEALSIVKYEITNNGSSTWNNFYFSIYSDMVVRNINTTTETGSAFFNKGGMGWLDDQYALYAFDRGSFDQPRINTHAATVILGSEYRGVEFHPRRADEVEAAGLPVPTVSPDFWLFGAGTGDLSRPNGDLERYNRMSTTWPLEQYRQTLREDGASADGNFIQLNTLGPVPEVEPGETITFYVAFVAAVMPSQFQNIIPGNQGSADDIDNPQSRENLTENIGWAYRLFDGQVDEDGERTRFLVPEPPDTPNMRVELDAGITSIYWDDRAEFSVDPVTGEEDFAGYRLYRTQIGDDLRGTISTNAQMLREWDVPGDGRGFNTGFEEVRLDQPVTFPDDPVEYRYRFDLPGMLSGWQYLLSVTAFDRGDERTPPLETSINANAVRVFPGTAVNENFSSSSSENKVGVYPNPYRVNAAWDGGTSLSRKLHFFNLPSRADIRIYTLAGEIVAELNHESDTYQGDTRWFRELSSSNRVMSGGEHAWDLLSEANQNLATGLYLFTVQDRDSGEVQRGRFAIIK